MAAKPAWSRRAGESKEAYAAFEIYYRLPVRERSIDAAYRARNPQAKSNHANGAWTGWSAKYEWVARALAHDDHLAEQDAQLWEERRRRLREQDWSQAEEVRGIITDALPYAHGFIRRQKNVIRRPGQTTTIITETFDITALALVLEKASKIQRLSTGDSTENINNLSGAALDAIIDRELDRRLAGIADDGQTPDAGTPAGNEADADASATGGVEALQG